FGITGNDQIGDYQYLDSWSSASFPYDGISGLTPTRVYNPNYGWETNKKLEFGLELGFLNDRILLSTNYFQNRSGNQLVGISLSGQSGFTEYTANSPAEVQNSGCELELNTINIDHKNFKWNTNFNITFQKNKLLAYENLAASADASAYEIGKSIRIIKGFNFTGVDPSNGVATFLDVDKNGAISDPADYIIIGETLPKFYGGFGNEFIYRNLSLEIFFQFVKQEGINNDYGPLVGVFGGMTNKRIAYLDYWKQPGDQTDIPRPSLTSSKPAYQAYSSRWRYSDAAWEDASYIRLKNFRLSYNISNLLQKAKINGSVFILGQNLFTITKYTGLDPEINGFDRRFVYPINPFGSVRAQGLPVLRTITFGINLSI
ncbi:MAG TPA: SusC/RagA family TonB-linked outer membrane protein, partial [Niabella sp.]|nr:SusC/RagA family TonB-linked outer membrane protein [Niabella sp.]